MGANHLGRSSRDCGLRMNDDAALAAAAPLPTLGVRTLGGVPAALAACASSVCDACALALAGRRGLQEASGQMPTLSLLPPTEHQPLSLADIGVDQWGAVLLACSAAAVLAAWCYCRWRSWRSARGRMPPVAAGQLRLAAARGRVDDLRLLSTLPGFQVCVGRPRSRAAYSSAEPHSWPPDARSPSACSQQVDADLQGFTPLLAACVQGHAAAAAWLLHRGADPTRCKADGW